MTAKSHNMPNYNTPMSSVIVKIQSRDAWQNSSAPTPKCLSSPQ